MQPKQNEIIALQREDIEEKNSELEAQSGTLLKQNEIIRGSNLRLPPMHGSVILPIHWLSLIPSRNLTLQISIFRNFFLINFQNMVLECLWAMLMEMVWKIS